MKIDEKSTNIEQKSITNRLKIEQKSRSETKKHIFSGREKDEFDWIENIDFYLIFSSGIDIPLFMERPHRNIFMLKLGGNFVIIFQWFFQSILGCNLGQKIDKNR